MRQSFIVLVVIILTACGGGGSTSGGGGGNPVAGQFDKFQVTPVEHNLELKLSDSVYGQPVLATALVRKRETANFSLPPPNIGNVKSYYLFIRAQNSSHDELIYFKFCAGKNIRGGSKIRKGKCTDGNSVRARETSSSKLIIVQDRH